MRSPTVARFPDGVLSETDAAGRITRYTYDERGNRNGVRDPQDKLTEVLYHPRFAKPIETIDPLGNRTRLDYDANGNLTAATDGEGQTTRYTYTAKGALKTIIDGLSNVTTYEHNAAKRDQLHINFVGIEILNKFQ